MRFLTTPASCETCWPESNTYKITSFISTIFMRWIGWTSSTRWMPILLATAALAKSTSDWPLNSAEYFTKVRDRIATFASSGQLGPFANAYWGHPAYQLPPEANLMAVAHYLEALDWQREVIKVHAILGAKNPALADLPGRRHGQPHRSQQPGGHQCRTPLARSSRCFAKAQDFVNNVYLPDVLAVAPFYLEWAGVGEGIGNFLSYGDFPDANGQPFFPAGVILNRDLSTVHPVEQEKIFEYVSHSWYDYADGNEVGLHPWDGETTPNYTGPKPPYEFLNTGPEDAYTWMKAPRLERASRWRSDPWRGCWWPMAPGSHRCRRP